MQVAQSKPAVCPFIALPISPVASQAKFSSVSLRELSLMTCVVLSLGSLKCKRVQHLTSSAARRIMNPCTGASSRTMSLLLRKILKTSVIQLPPLFLASYLLPSHQAHLTQACPFCLEHASYFLYLQTFTYPPRPYSVVTSPLQPSQLLRALKVVIHKSLAQVGLCRKVIFWLLEVGFTPGIQSSPALIPAFLQLVFILQQAHSMWWPDDDQHLRFPSYQ